MGAVFLRKQSTSVLTLICLASSFSCASDGNGNSSTNSSEFVVGGKNGGGDGGDNSSLDSQNARPRGTGGTKNTGRTSSITTPQGGATNSSSTTNTSPRGGATSTSSTTNTGGKAGATATGGTSNIGGTTNVGGTANTGSKSTGCGKSPPYVGAQYLKISVDGKSRDYLLNVPDPYDTNKPLAVVFAFHGSGGTKDGSGSGELIHAPNAAQDAIFVSPQGLNYSYGGVNYGVGWDEDCTGIDVKLVDAIIQQLSSSFCIASNRIFATGYSWGADFSNALGCCRGNVIRAVAPASGAEWGDVLGFNLDCGTRPLPAFRITYGDKDDGYTQTAFSNLIKVYRTGNHCQTSSVAITPSPCVSYQGCDHQVIECKYAGMGHVAPPNWGVDTWSFFASFQ